MLEVELASVDSREGKQVLNIFEADFHEVASGPNGAFTTGLPAAKGSHSIRWRTWIFPGVRWGTIFVMAASGSEAPEN